MADDYTKITALWHDIYEGSELDEQQAEELGHWLSDACPDDLAKVVRACYEVGKATGRSQRDA